MFVGPSQLKGGECRDQFPDLRPHKVSSVAERVSTIIDSCMQAQRTCMLPNLLPSLKNKYRLRPVDCHTLYNCGGHAVYHPCRFKPVR